MSAREDLLLEAIIAVDRCRQRMEQSVRKLAALFPLSGDRLESLTADETESLDAFLKRFEQLVSSIQDQAFRAIALRETEDLRFLSRRDVAELMSRLSAIPSAEVFTKVVRARNRLTHTYPTRPHLQAQQLNDAFAAAAEASRAAEALVSFARQRYQLAL